MKTTSSRRRADVIGAARVLQRNISRSCLRPSLPQPESTRSRSTQLSGSSAVEPAPVQSVTHSGLVERVLLQAEEPASLASLQGRGRGRGQQVGRLGNHGRTGGRGEGSCQREALQLPLPLLLQHLAHHHLLLLGEAERRGFEGRAVRR